mgnify:FL=1
MKIKILFVDKPEREVLEKIKEKHQDDIDGIAGLYDDLIEHGTCESTVSYQIYYVAYTLGLEDIELTLVKMN